MILTIFPLVSSATSGKVGAGEKGCKEVDGSLMKGPPRAASVIFRAGLSRFEPASIPQRYEK